MDKLEHINSLNPLKKLHLFCKASFALPMHIAYSLVVFLAFEAFIVAVYSLQNKVSWDIGIQSLVSASTIFLVLFFIRVIDEIKDYEYDKVQNPSRPLVIGLVSFKDLYAYLFISGLIVLVINYIYFSKAVMFLLIFELIYSYFLLYLEKSFSLVENNIIVNLFVTFPINVLLNVYTYMCWTEKKAIELETWQLILVLIFFAFSFLHYEFARKTPVKLALNIGKRYYSDVLGLKGCFITTVLLGNIGAIGSSLMMKPWKLTGIPACTAWIPLLTTIVIYINFIRYYKLNAKTDIIETTPMTKMAMLFLALYLLALIIHESFKFISI